MKLFYLIFNHLALLTFKYYIYVLQRYLFDLSLHHQTNGRAMENLMKTWMSANREKAISIMNQHSVKGVSLKEMSLAVIERDDLWMEFEYQNESRTDMMRTNYETGERVPLYVEGEVRFESVVAKVAGEMHLDSDRLAASNREQGEARIESIRRQTGYYFNR